MREAGIREARLNLSRLIEEVEKGHEITITDGGRPVARLVPPLPSKSRAVSRASCIPPQNAEVEAAAFSGHHRCQRRTNLTSPRKQQNWMVCMWMRALWPSCTFRNRKATFSTDFSRSEMIS